MSKKREKKWKKEEVRGKILEYLAKEGEATKYKIQKDLKIPLATVLQVMKDLENEGLIEYKIGKRGGHVCRLTLNGLLYCLNKGTVDLERAKEIFLEMLKANGVTKDEIIKILNIPEKALSLYIKLYLEYLIHNYSEVITIDDIVLDLRGKKASAKIVVEEADKKVNEILIPNIWSLRF